MALEPIETAVVAPLLSFRVHLKSDFCLAWVRYEVFVIVYHLPYHLNRLSFGNFFEEEKFNPMPSKNKVADEKKLVKSGKN